ncbi:MAG: metallophosphoesterase [Lachnospiraceae bacterium]|nr:metallophosphoesterase [Lachnospiraceae bacterium]
MSILDNKILLIFLIIIALYIIIYIISKIECKLYKINTFDVKNIKNNQKIKLVFISDFHNKKFKNDYSEFIDSIVSINPDFIVFGGDFVDFSTVQSKRCIVKYKNTLKFFDKLSKKCYEIMSTKNYNLKGIYFGFGNHELRLKNRIDNNKLIGIYNEFIDCLHKNDIKILEDGTLKLIDGITISGLNLYDGYYKNLFEKNPIHDHIDRSILDKHFSNLNKNDFNIIMFHKPDYCEDLINFGFDLVLSGHNHGGLINFPVIGPIFSPDLKLFPKYNVGLYGYKNGNVIVSKGIGEHFIKIRVNNLPEICVININ